jgi:hypothetical protein
VLALVRGSPTRSGGGSAHRERFQHIDLARIAAKRHPGENCTTALSGGTTMMFAGSENALPPDRQIGEFDRAEGDLKCAEAEELNSHG